VKTNVIQNDTYYIPNKLIEPYFVKTDGNYIYICFDKPKEHILDTKYTDDNKIWFSLFRNNNALQILI